jgi:hypothetical protein
MCTNSILDGFPIYVGYFVIRLYTTRVKCIITLLSLHVSALLGHHQVPNVYNYNIKDIPIQRIRFSLFGIPCAWPLVNSRPSLYLFGHI